MTGALGTPVNSLGCSQEIGHGTSKMSPKGYGVDPIFRWNGEYFGFVHRWRLFDSRSYYLGWVDEGEVWRRDGTFLGGVGGWLLRAKEEGGGAEDPTCADRSAVASCAAVAVGS